jgi:hypothetical protein
MAEVFLSYKSEDRPRVEVIARAIEAEGVAVWWDPVLRSGQDYQDVVDTNLRTALVVVVLWSPQSVKSRWVRSEATVGDRRGALLPVMVEPCERPVAFELVQTADLSNWRGDRAAPQWRAFVADLRAMLVERRTEATTSPSAATMTAGDLEALFWSSIKDSTDASDFESYLSRYPSGHFADLARRRLGSPRRDLRKVWPIPAAIAALIVGSLVLFFGNGFRGENGRTSTTGTKPPESPTSSVPAVPADKALDIWFAGSPHGAEMPSENLSVRIGDAARSLGYTVKTRGLLATDFLPELLKALDAGTPPDVIFVDNFMHVSGGQTSQGMFTGMRSVPHLRERVIRVDEALSDLGKGWAFLIDKSPDHEGAAALVGELSGCDSPLAKPDIQTIRALQLQAEGAARGFLACNTDPAILDQKALSRRCSAAPIEIRRVSVCRITAATRLAFVETSASVASKQQIGRRSIVSVHRFDDGWHILAVSSDPVSVGATTGQWRELARRFTDGVATPSPGTLQSPDGLFPSPAQGQRFGNFTWRPGSGGIAQIIEMANANDVRLFLVGSGEQQISTGQLWSTNGEWRWRVWTVGSDGSVAISDSRSFRH